MKLGASTLIRDRLCRFGYGWVAGICLVLSGYFACAGTALAISEPYAVIQRLDKITARTNPIELRIGDHARFGSLDIEVKICHRSAPEDEPENAAFIEIRELRDGQSAVLLFRGWMFSSSPALSALEHPVYDVWLVSCRNAPSSSGNTATGKDASARNAAPSSTE